MFGSVRRLKERCWGWSADCHFIAAKLVTFSQIYGRTHNADRLAGARLNVERTWAVCDEPGERRQLQRQLKGQLKGHLHRSRHDRSSLLLFRAFERDTLYAPFPSHQWIAGPFSSPATFNGASRTHMHVLAHSLIRSLALSFSPSLALSLTRSLVLLAPLFFTAPVV